MLFSSDAAAVSSQWVRVPQKKDVLCGSLGLGHEFTIAQQLAMTFVSWAPGLIMWNIKHCMHVKLCNTWNMQENVSTPTRNQVDLILRNVNLDEMAISVNISRLTLDTCANWKNKLDVMSLEDLRNTELQITPPPSRPCKRHKNIVKLLATHSHQADKFSTLTFIWH